MFKSSENLSSSDLDNIGNKGRGLLQLRNLGYAVPDFLILPAGRNYSFEDIRKIVEALPQAWTDAVAVRSSGLQEDLASASFAGIYESVLNLKGHEAVTNAIWHVLQSASSSRAQHYKQLKDIQHKDLQMGIILQKMLTPKFSGVAFGVNPVDGNPNTVWISMTEGLGDKLVSGEVQGYEAAFRNEHIEWIGNSVPRDIDLADKAAFKELAQCTQALSRVFQKAQDIEWAWDGQKLWFLQCRAVTHKAKPPDGPELVFDNSNIQESYCGVTTPLTFSYASKAYAQVYDQTLKFMGVPKKQVEAARFRHENLLALVRGRVYYNINHWYETLLELPSFGKRKQEMEDMMGLERPVDFIKDNSKTLAGQLQTVPVYAVLVTKLLWKFYRMKALVAEFDSWFWGIYRSANIEDIYKLDDYELSCEIRRLQDAFLEKWGIPILNDLKVMMLMGSVKRALAKHGLSNEIKSFIYGSEIESVKPTLEIHRLAKLAAGDLRIKQVLLDFRGERCLSNLLISSPSFYHEVKSFIQLYGDRCMGELKLETITMRQDSEIFLNLLRHFIAGGLDKKKRLFESESGSSIHQKLVAVPTFQKRSLIKKIESLKQAVAHREHLRFHRTRNFGLMRSLYLALGERWAEQKLIADGRDIFFLTMQEIEAYGMARNVSADLKAIISSRKSEWASYHNQPTPPQLRLRFPAAVQKEKDFGGPPEPLVTGMALKGLACAQGVVEGEIKYVRSSEEATDLFGKILLAERTDPGWTPLFALIKGVIVERGSLLSHSAVIAREMAIPAVIAVPQVTQILKDGDYVRLDGNLGTIEIIAEKSGVRLGPQNSEDRLQASTL